MIVNNPYKNEGILKKNVNYFGVPPKKLGGVNKIISFLMCWDEKSASFV